MRYKLGIRDVNLITLGTGSLTAKFTTEAIKMWDTMRPGRSGAGFTNNKMAFVSSSVPNEDKQLDSGGTSSNKILCWDIRSGDHRPGV